MAKAYVSQTDRTKYMTEPSEPSTFIINSIAVEPGEHKTIRLPVGELPSGTKISIRAHVYRSTNPGPTVLILGGVHGDEINGVEIVRRSIQKGLYEDLQCGSVIAIPILNIYGFINFSRAVPDGKDVNRSFPGTTKGSLASRVARSLTKKILPLVDFGIDFHTGGHSHYNYPQVRYSKNDPTAQELAKVFGAKYTLGMKTIRKSLRKVALDQEKPILVFEGGENLRYDGISIENGLDGIQRVLHYHKMLSEAPAIPPTIHYQQTTWVRASNGGMFLWMKQSGHPVKQGEPLGRINDPFGMEADVYVLSPHDGHIIGHNNAPVVSPGDALFHIAY